MAVRWERMEADVVCVPTGDVIVDPLSGSNRRARASLRLPGMGTMRWVVGIIIVVCCPALLAAQDIAIEGRQMPVTFGLLLGSSDGSDLSFANPLTIDDAPLAYDPVQLASHHSSVGLKSSEHCDGCRESCSKSPAAVQWCRSLDARAKETKTFGPNFSRIEYQLDTRGFNTLHYMASSALPYGFNMWGFVDFEGLDAAGANREDISRLFLEIDLKRKIGENWGGVAELNDLQGDDNVIGRLGLFYVPPWKWIQDGHGFLFFKTFPYQTNSAGSQYSVAWNKNFPNVFDGRLSAGGFCDLNVNQGASFDDVIVVTEHQLRARIVGGLHLITEVRLNQFLPADREFGIGFGVQYRF